TPLSPPPCDPQQSSPPCPTATPTPIPCNPSPGSGPNSPPCPTPTPCNPSVYSWLCPVQPVAGGELYIGTPEIVGGKIRVPINTTLSPNTFMGFNVDLVFDGTFGSVVSPATDAVIGEVFDALPGGSFCARLPN